MYYTLSPQAHLFDCLRGPQVYGVRFDLCILVARGVQDAHTAGAAHGDAAKRGRVSEVCEHIQVLACVMVSGGLSDCVYE